MEIDFNAIPSFEPAPDAGRDAPQAKHPEPTHPEPPPSADTLERNLEHFERRSPAAARAIRDSSPAAGLRLEQAASGSWIVCHEHAGRWRPLASRRRPEDEGERLAQLAETDEHATVCVSGFAAGHHVRAIAESMGRSGMLVVFEPDVGLLRHVLERVDCTEWMARCNLALVVDARDEVAITRAFEGAEAVVALGFKTVEHAPSVQRWKPLAAGFGASLANVIRSVRTTLATTLVMAETTARNSLMNADRIGASPHLGALRGAATGRAAVVVSAGPSLARNIEVLSRPGVRDRVVIIAVQTVLKTLLEAGVRPHFVTALDHHEISARFYEGLSARDVEGVTLVVEPKANPAIVESFPGRTIFVGSELLRTVLPGAEGLVPDAPELEAGATVAHLAYFLARFMGCDPVILAGQDLGFTDGQYYSAGAAIHNVWAGELGPFNTLEMFEWERIARAKNLLRKATDQLDRPIYLDEQMAAYLTQFESMFDRDTSAGRTVIDATEGGTRKRHTREMPLAIAIDTYASGEPWGFECPGPGAPSETRAFARQMREGAGAADEIAECSERTASLLRELADNLDKPAAVQNRLIERIHANRAKVEASGAAWRLVRFINQSGTLRRLRADRAIDRARVRAEGLPASERDAEQHRLRVERDRLNVEVIAEAAQRASQIYSGVADALEGRCPRLTRAPGGERVEVASPSAGARVMGLVVAPFTAGGLGQPRSIEEPIAGGFGPLWWTVRRMLEAEGLDGVTVLTDAPEWSRALLASLPERGLDRLSIVEHPLKDDRRAAIASARRFAPDTWRGGLGRLSVFDEIVLPLAVRETMAEQACDAAVVVGGDWAAVCPRLTEKLVERFRENPDEHQIVFSQAAPGLCGVLLHRGTADALADAASSRAPFATVGGLLSYNPSVARADPIARPNCVTVDPTVRDVGRRVIADTRAMRTAIADVLSTTDGPGPDAMGFVRALRHAWTAGDAPRHLTLELCTGRLAGGRLVRWRREAHGTTADTDRAPMGTERARRLIERYAARRPDGAITFDGAGDPLMHPGLLDLARHARSVGLAVHVRTDLVAARCGIDELAAVCDVVSVDVLASDPETYARLTGHDRHERVFDGVRALIAHQQPAGPLARPWVVPRLTRCDAVYEQIEGLYDLALRSTGCGMIDPMPVAAEGERIAPLPIPPLAAERFARNEAVVLADGTIPDGVGGSVNLADHADSLSNAWQEVCRRRRARGPGGAVPVVRASNTKQYEESAA